MIGSNRSNTAFKSFEKAAKSVPRGGPLRILVFNQRGLPVLQFGDTKLVSKATTDEISAMGVKLSHDILNQVDQLNDNLPNRIAFFYDEEVVTIERDDAFIFFIVWSTRSFKVDTKFDTYIKRLGVTLKEELT